jgi:hypothetical protein
MSLILPQNKWGHTPFGVFDRKIIGQTLPFGGAKTIISQQNSTTTVI